MVAVIAAEIDRLQKWSWNFGFCKRQEVVLTGWRIIGFLRTLQHDWVSYVLGTVHFYLDIFKGLMILNFELKYALNGTNSN